MTSPRRNAVDLHTHTARSDGVLEPRDLYAQMQAWGSTLVAITDHDTLAGARELLTAGCGGADAPGPRIIVGVEINTSPDEAVRSVAGPGAAPGELHILGLGVDPHDDAFETVLAGQRGGRRARLERTLERLDGLGAPVRDRLPRPKGGIDSLGRPHVARALVSAGHADSVDDAFARYLEPGGSAYVPRVGIGTRAAIEAIRAAGGVAVLAHSPWVPQRPAVLDLLTDWGLGGLEVWYPGWDEVSVERMADTALERDLVATGGSDYHGDRGDYAAAQALTHVPPEAGERLLAVLERS